MSGSGTLASLVVDLKLNSASLREGLDAAAAKVKGFASSVNTAFAGVQDMAKGVKRAANEIAQAGLGLAAVAGGAVALAAQVDKGIAAEVKNLKNSFTDLAVPIARLVVPAMRELADKVRAVADFIAGLSPHTKEMLSRFIAVAAAVGGVALVISKLAAAIGAISGVIAAITAGPVLALVAGLAVIAATALFVHKVWRENWGGIQEKTRTVVEAIAGYWASFKTWFGTSFIDWMIDKWATFEKVLARAANLQRALTPGSGRGLDDLGKDNRRSDARIDQWAESMKGGGLADAVLTLGRKMKDGFVSAAGALKDELKLILDGIKIDFGKADRYGSTKGPTVDQVRMDAIMEMTSASYQAVAEATEIAGLKAAKELAAVGGMFLSAGRTVATGLLEQAKPVADALEDIAEAFLKGGIAGAAEEIAAANETSKFTQALSAGAGIITARMGEIGQVINSAAQGFASGGPWGAIIAVVAEFVSRLKVFTQFSDMLNAKLNRSLGDLNNAAGPLFEQLKKLSDALNPLREVIHAVIRLVLSVLAPIIGLIGKLLGALAPVFNVLTNVIDGLAVALGGIIEIIVQSLGPTLESIGLVCKILGATINFAALGIMGIALGLVRAVQEIIKAFGGNVTSIKATGDAIEKKGNEMLQRQKEWDLFGAPTAPVNAPTNELKDFGAATNDAAAGAGALAETLGELVHNIPNVYRGLKAAQWNASGGGAPGSGDSPDTVYGDPWGVGGPSKGGDAYDTNENMLGAGFAAGIASWFGVEQASGLMDISATAAAEGMTSYAGGPDVGDQGMGEVNFNAPVTIVSNDPVELYKQIKAIAKVKAGQTARTSNSPLP